MREKRERVIKIDPRIFISKPYINCPKCGEKHFGVLMIPGSGYTRRCRSCWHTESFKLPPIRKKLIYLDQFVISNIMKTLNPRSDAHKRVSEDPYWLELYKKLDTLHKYQLIICPDSFYHRYESLVGKDFPDMQRIYEHLSNGTTFYDENTITRLQIHEHFQNYLKGEPTKSPMLSAEQIVFGDIHKWYDRIRVGIKDRAREGDVEQIRKGREASYERFKKVFSHWQKETERKFEDWMMEEARGFGKSVWQNLVNFRKRQIEFMRQYPRVGKIDLDVIFPPPSNDILEDMIRACRENGIEEEGVLQKINEYFNSEHILVIPSIKITAMLFAAIARKAAAGQVRPPSRGVFNDVNAIAGFLPYCDALFVDNESAAYMNEEPLRTELRFPIRIFSPNTKEQFLNYLNEIMENADSKHIELVKEVYGDDWGEPFLTILTYRDED